MQWSNQSKFEFQPQKYFKYEDRHFTHNALFSSVHFREKQMKCQIIEDFNILQLLDITAIVIETLF